MVDFPFSDKKYDLDHFDGKPKTYYFICSTGRCGSNLLCGLLIKTGVMGVPQEYFNIGGNGAPLIERFGIPVSPELNTEVYFEKIEKYRTTKNGVFGVKGHINQFFPFVRSGFIKLHF